MTALNVTTTSDLPGLRSRLVRRLEAFREQVRNHLLLEGFARWLGEALAVAVASFVLDRLFRLGLPLRMAILTVALAFLTLELWRWVIRPLLLDLDVVGLADAIDRAGGPDVVRSRGVLAARVASVLQLPELLNTPAAPSPAMVRAAVARCHAALDAVHFENHISPARRQRAVAALALLVVVPLAITAAAPRAVGLWFSRYFLASNEAWPQRAYLVVAGIEGGRIRVPKAEPFVLRVTAREGSQSPDGVTLRYHEGRGPRTTVAMQKFAPGDFRYDFPPLAANADVEVTGDDDVQSFTIEPVERPRVTELILTSRHPTEDKPTPHNFAGDEADFSFLPKTQMVLSFKANVPIAGVKLASNVPSPGPNDLARVGDRQFSLSWTHEAPVQLQIELIGAAANLTSLPTPVAVGLKQDLPPRVSLTYSGVRARVTPQARIPLAIQARDDYGIARVDLVTKAQVLALDAAPVAATAPATAPSTQPATETRTLVGPVLPPTDLEVQVPHELSVAELRLPAGSILSVSAAAVDACYLGAQTGASRVVTFRVVPPEELFKEILLRQQSERMKFRKQVDEATKLRDALKTLASPDEAQALARQHRQVQRESARVANALAESVTEMRLNALGGQEAWDLMDKNVLGPLRKLNDEEMNQQKDALDGLNPGDAAAVSAAAERQDKIVTRMAEILKQMSQWDSFVDVINQLNEIIRLEGNVKKSTEQMKKKQTEGIFD